ncbi:MAG: 2Fe-2S iron-sulfur cluster-binding protein [Candidatus Sumerlaeota bacterium]|nr:2Fe-2S iron-sulfur cluster-binding protein [Candidatus Sumerlaeota bacterium]
MTEDKKHVSVFIMGKKFSVPAGSTIMSALEYSGFQLKRGVGCREGFCGACATVYRLRVDYKIRTGLACQTVVVDEMLVAQIPFVPAGKPVYDIRETGPVIGIFKHDCIRCGLCALRCPAEIGQFNVAILAQRLYGRYLAPPSRELAERVEQIRRGEFVAGMADMKGMDKAKLKKIYYERDIEPGESV